MSTSVLFLLLAGWILSSSRSQWASETGSQCRWACITTIPEPGPLCSWVTYTSTGVAKDRAGWHPPEKTSSAWLLSASPAVDPLWWALIWEAREILKLWAHRHKYSLCLFSQWSFSPVPSRLFITEQAVCHHPQVHAYLRSFLPLHKGNHQVYHLKLCLVEDSLPPLNFKASASGSLGWWQSIFS